MKFSFADLLITHDFYFFTRITIAILFIFALFMIFYIVKLFAQYLFKKRKFCIFLEKFDDNITKKGFEGCDNIKKKRYSYEYRIVAEFSSILKYKDFGFDYFNILLNSRINLLKNHVNLSFEKKKFVLLLITLLSMILGIFSSIIEIVRSGVYFWTAVVKTGSSIDESVLICFWFSLIPFFLSVIILFFSTLVNINIKFIFNYLEKVIFLIAEKILIFSLHNDVSETD